MTDPEIHTLTGTGWRAYGAYIDPLDTIPGPGRVKLHRVGNKLHAYAWFQHRVPSTVMPGTTATMSLTVGEISTLKSALVFAGAPGRPELRVDWTTARPRVSTLMGSDSAPVVEGWVTAQGREFWQMNLRMTNATRRPVHLLPTFYVTRGAENAGLDLGLHAGDTHFEMVPQNETENPPRPNRIGVVVASDYVGAMP